MTTFSAKRALREYRANKSVWAGGAVIVRAFPHGFQAIPSALRNDASYTGSREAVPISDVMEAARQERAKPTTKTPKTKVYWQGRLISILAAIEHLKASRKRLAAVGADQAAGYVRRALKSAQGAHRHALRMVTSSN